MYAIALTVNIGSNQFASAREYLKTQIVPRVSQMPGFVHGYWTTSVNHDRGASLVVFKTREAAEQSLATARNMPLPNGVTMGAIELMEVTEEARAAAV